MFILKIWQYFNYKGHFYECVQPERFKTRAHFPIWRNERTGMQRATLGKSGSKTASQLQGRTARAFSSGSLVKTMEMTAVIQYILPATQSFGSQDYCKKSRMTILGLILRERAGIDKIDFRMSQILGVINMILGRTK